jgi:hypothetical protein
MKEESSENPVLTITDYIQILEERCIVLETEIQKLKDSHNNLLQHYSNSQINYYELSQHDHSLQQTNNQLRTLLNLQQKSIEELVDRYRIVEEQNRQLSILFAEVSKTK